MAIADRSFAEVLGDVIRTVQEIVRSEVRLAKAEMREEAARAKSSALLFISGTVITLFAVLFCLLAVAFSLALIMPIWAATLITGMTLAGAGAVTIQAGFKRLRELYPTAERTVGIPKGDR